MHTVPKSIRWQPALTLVLICCLFCPSVLRSEEERLTEEDLNALSSEQFLEEVRRPLKQDAWGAIKGRMTYSGEGKQLKADISIRLTFSPDAMQAQIDLDGKNVYGFEQIHNAPPGKQFRLDLPEHEIPPGLFSFGVQPEDLTFAFIYWDYIRELPPDQFRRRQCRVFELAHPEREKGTVRVWFSSQYGFPLQAQWYLPNAEEPWRELELKGAKKHDDDLWFVKEMRLEGKGWKTQVKFDEVSLNPLEEKAPPE